jgi:hypothetical protein
MKADNSISFAALQLLAILEICGMAAFQGRNRTVAGFCDATAGALAGFRTWSGSAGSARKGRSPAVNSAIPLCQ